MKTYMFQYWIEEDDICDKINLSLNEAKNLYNYYYDDIVKNVKNGKEVQIGIFEVYQDGSLGETIIHLCNPTVTNGVLTEQVYHEKFRGIE